MALKAHNSVKLGVLPSFVFMDSNSWAVSLSCSAVFTVISMVILKNKGQKYRMPGHRPPWIQLYQQIMRVPGATGAFAWTLLHYGVHVFPERAINNGLMLTWIRGALVDGIADVDAEIGGRRLVQQTLRAREGLREFSEIEVVLGVRTGSQNNVGVIGRHAAPIRFVSVFQCHDPANRTALTFPGQEADNFQTRAVAA